MLAAASIKVMDALFGLLARNDAECCKRELLGRSWRRDRAMRIFRAFCPIGQNIDISSVLTFFDILEGFGIVLAHSRGQIPTVFLDIRKHRFFWKNQHF